MTLRFSSIFFVFSFMLLQTASYADASPLEKQVEALEIELSRVEEEREGLTPLSSEDMKAIVDGGVGWFLKAQEESGHFTYEYLPEVGTYRTDDNIVRQAGALYLLGEIAVRDAEDTFDLEETLEKSVEYFEDLSIDGTYDGKKFRCISDNGNRCKLGASSLALIGGLDVAEAYPALKKRYEPLLMDYAEYILAMQKENGGFRNSYNSKSDLQSPDESSFSNGEALFALVRYGRHYPSSGVSGAIERALTYLESPQVPFDSSLYLWVMAALKDVQEIAPHDRHVEYAKKYTDWRIGGVSLYQDMTHNLCAYVEGVVSAYSIIAPHATEHERQMYRDEIDRWLGRSAALQIKEGETYRVFYNDRGAPYLGEIKNPNLASGGFLTGLSDVSQRIDFTQHCLSAYVQTLVDIDKNSLVQD